MKPSFSQSLPVASKYSKTVTQNTLTISTINLFNYIEPPLACYDFDRIYSAQQWQKKQRWIQHHIEQACADIIGFQEVFSIDALHALVTTCDYPYFVTVDEPTIIDEHICRDPVVALASKYPIEEVSAVTLDKSLAKLIGLSSGFSESRKVLRATIKMPHLGLCDCYVVHFKSKRSSIEEEQLESSQVSLEITQIMAQKAGQWASTIQRGSEALLLHADMLIRRKDSKNPMIIMGDFNDKITIDTLSHFIAEQPNQLAIKEARQQNYSFELFDAWQLFIERYQETSKERVSTHYFRNKGAVLDYILLSSEFNAQFDNSFYHVETYQVNDKHLINPIYAFDSESSDHAFVTITLTLRH